jgi:hypothetical protein
VLVFFHDFESFCVLLLPVVLEKSWTLNSRSIDRLSHFRKLLYVRCWLLKPWNPKA